MRILLVEDEIKVASFIVKGLKEELYAVDHVIDAKTALIQVNVYPYDLIISDIIMPEMNGFELIRQLRNLQVEVPILILTAKDATDDKVIGLDVGADDYLTKPFAFAELMARIRALTRRKDNIIEKLEVGDLVMDSVKHLVKRGGTILDLTPREYSLMEFLLRNKGRVVTRTSIIEHVWDMHFNSDTNLVDVFISHLRRKVEDGFSSKLIHSVRAIGYILEERK